MALAGRFLPDGRSRVLGIIGNPIEHSLSPRLHTAVLRRLDRNLIYLPFPVAEDRLPDFVRGAGGFGIVGFNVTTPYKERVARLVRPLDEGAGITGVVNTVGYQQGEPWGTGTDGEGILGWIESLGLGHEPVAVLGFGATARCLMHRALVRGAPLSAVLTRRPEEISACLAEWGGAGVAVLAWPDLRRYPWRRGETPVVWVSTLPPSAPPLPEAFWSLLPRSARLLDLNYGVGRTGLVEEARRRGVRAADGLGPLCHQAARSLSLWLEEPVATRLFFGALECSERSLRPRR